MSFRNRRQSLRPSTLRRDGIIARQGVSAGIVDEAHGFPYSRNLDEHSSCVNALAFSSGEGRFLASGGDDLRICLWDFYQDDVKKPSYTLTGPKGNIFSLQFSATNKFLFSGGSSETVLKYDVEHLGSSVEPFCQNTPSEVFWDHSDSIRALTCHPTRDELFMSASEDGTIRRYDVRQPRRPGSTQDFIATQNEVTGVQYHPCIENLFVTSDGGGRVLLRDSRMAFGSSTARSSEGIVQRYSTKITRKSARHLSSPEPSSVIFDREGTKLAVSFLHFLPTIYAFHDPEPLAVLSGANLPDGTPSPPGRRTYSNSCTMKHGAFGGPGLDTDDMYAAGSDDFRGYVWKIPPLALLRERREALSAEEWLSSDSSRIAFTESKDASKTLPVELPTPLCRLTGHSSIVNTIVFHPHFLHVVTAGVEKRIILHSPTSSSPCTQNLTRSPSDVRQLDDHDENMGRTAYLAAIMGMVQPLSTDPESAEDENERQTLNLFDHILREEGEADVFNRRPCRSPSSSDEGQEDTDTTADESEEEEDEMFDPFV